MNNEIKTKTPTFTKDRLVQVNKILKEAKKAIEDIAKYKEVYSKNMEEMATMRTLLEMSYSTLSSLPRSYEDIRFDVIRTEYLGYDGQIDKRVAWSRKLEFAMAAQVDKTLYEKKPNVVYRVVLFRGDDEMDNVLSYEDKEING